MASLPLTQLVSTLVNGAFEEGSPRPLQTWLGRMRRAPDETPRHGILEVLADLSRCREPRELAGVAGNRLEELFQPEACAIYLRERRDFSSAFASGADAPPTIGSESSLMRALSDEYRSVPAREWLRSKTFAEVQPSDRAALESLRAAVLVPVRRNGTLDGMIALGPRRGRRGYGSADLVFLEAVAGSLATELACVREEVELDRRQRASERLSEYVPGAVADRIARGLDMRCGEREVSVLFVDIHGYTGYAERLTADEIFAVVNGYTKLVSEIVCRFGGTIVEFNGDGMMAVFGAPDEMGRKEQAAVETALALTREIEALSPVPRCGPLRIGTGVATGRAFVGNIQAVDRLIWSAIGNTTNLAARLQGLTHELDASIVIDGATRDVARTSARDFRPRHAFAIRGRRRAEDVYVLQRRRRDEM